MIYVISLVFQEDDWERLADSRKRLHDSQKDDTFQVYCGLASLDNPCPRAESQLLQDVKKRHAFKSLQKGRTMMAQYGLIQQKLT